jgi:hypothetical protein
MPMDDLAMAAEAAGEAVTTTPNIMLTSEGAPVSRKRKAATTDTSIRTGITVEHKTASTTPSLTVTMPQKNKKARAVSRKASTTGAPSSSPISSSSLTTLTTPSRSPSMSPTSSPAGPMARSSSSLTISGAASPLLTGLGGSSDQKRVLSLLRRLQPTDGGDDNDDISI